MTSSEATATVFCVLTPARWNNQMAPPQAATLGSHFVYVVQSILARVYTHQNPPDLEWAPRHCMAVVTTASLNPVGSHLQSNYDDGDDADDDADDTDDDDDDAADDDGDGGDDDDE